ncbi:MAG: hypothetical protein J0L75_04300 [Spirochaetes bacterium]|nr:hypothetical protein [Spirochaetota bacterium]
MTETKAAKPAAVPQPPPPLPVAPVTSAPPEPAPPAWKPLEDGLRQIVEHKNTHFASAFMGRTGDNHAITVTRDEFMAVLDRAGILPPARNVPDRFEVTVKFSPIALFKKWIFTLSNKRFLKVSERAKEFERDFYVFIHQDYVCFQALSTNIAHEKFLVTVFERKYIPEPVRTREGEAPAAEKKPVGDWTTEFRTYFNEEKKLVLFKDYLNRKASSVQFTQALVPGRLYDVKVSVVKDPKSAKFRVWVGGGAPVTHMIKFSGRRKATVVKSKPSPAAAASAKEPESQAAGFKSFEDFRKEVMDLLIKVNATKKKTNKFANISLGRVNKIPVLINLPSKYRDTQIKISLTKGQELVIFDLKDIEIRTYTVAKSPKSNWLEKKA